METAERSQGVLPTAEKVSPSFGSAAEQEDTHQNHVTFAAYRLGFSHYSNVTTYKNHSTGLHEAALPLNLAETLLGAPVHHRHRQLIVLVLSAPRATIHSQ